MVSELFQLGTVTVSLAALLIAPFLPIAFFLDREGDWPKKLLSAVIIGCGAQAVLGFLWSHLVGRQPFGEIVALLILWALGLILSYREYIKNGRRERGHREKTRHVILIGILFAAFIVRILHPLQVAYLGQSDAYTHLNYLHDIIERGRLHNPVYPSGYHWVLALPALVLSIDPYVITRFGGAFFGVALVLAIYVLLEQLFSKKSAIFGSFCAACFPPMTLLMKTGVGAFANQLGLLLVPSALLFYVLIISGKGKEHSAGFLFLLALSALAAAVPMMLIHVLLIIGMERLIIVPRMPEFWFKRTAWISLLMLPFACLLLLHFKQVGSGQRFQTATILMGYSNKKQPSAEKVNSEAMKHADPYSTAKKRTKKIIKDSLYTRLMIDYFTVKRHGFGNVYLNVSGCMLLGIFIGFVGYGIKTEKNSFLVLGLWGTLTAVQAVTGFLQFSAYQREGWSLLVAICCMVGIVSAWIYQFGKKFLLFRAGVATIMLFSFLWTVRYPPRHPEIHSSAEGLIVKSARFFAQSMKKKAGECIQGKKPVCSVVNLLDPDFPLSLVTRRFVAWKNQGEIVANVLPRENTVENVTISNGEKKTIFEKGRQYIVLIDKKNKTSDRKFASAFNMVNPGMVTATFQKYKSLFEANAKILGQIYNLPKNKWQVEQVHLSDNLTAFVIIPSNGKDG